MSEPNTEYPKWIYHDTEPARIVNSFEEHDEAGDEWRETPSVEAESEAGEDKPKRTRKKKTEE